MPTANESMPSLLRPSDQAFPEHRGCGAAWASALAFAATALATALASALGSALATALASALGSALDSAHASAAPDRLGFRGELLPHPGRIRGVPGGDAAGV